MIKQYWQFIWGLQYNAERFFNDQINYYDISHQWTNQSCDVFLVRDFQTNTLLYDSIDNLVLHFAEQQFKHCSLYPLSIIFPNGILTEHHFFEFISSDYPVVVFKNKWNKAFALIQVEQEKPSKEIRPLGDPREFWSPISSQSQTTTFGLFTLIELNQSQKNECHLFDQNLTWNSLIENIHMDIMQSDFASSLGINFQYTNNLYFNSYDHHESPLISNHTLPDNLGFSLIQMLEPIEDSVKSFTDIRNENSDYRFFSTEQHALFEKFKTQKDQLLIQLICFTANHMESAMHFSKLQKQQLVQWEQASNHVKEIQNHIKEEQDAEQRTTEQPITTFRTFMIISIFIIILFTILYEFYWLISKFEFIKFIFFTTGMISFLYIISKK